MVGFSVVGDRCLFFGVAVLLTKQRPSASSQSTGFSLPVMGKSVNQWIVVGELVASYFY